jgi:hypothetical protein
MLCYYTSEMSCPHFYPTESRGGSALLPLLDSWTGLCHADPAHPALPPNTLTCNLGYARGQCARFPNDTSPDAVRFTISHFDANGLLLYYVIERDHHPFAYGPLEYSFTSGFPHITDPLLKQQATAYVKSYQRRKREQ